MAVRIGINGFGRIGRGILRAATADSYRGAIQVVHINDLTETKVSAHLLKYDSVHGHFPGEVSVQERGLQIDGQKVAFSAYKDPAAIDWRGSQVDIVLECSGIFRKREQAQKHLAAGAKKVIISAPASGEDITIVYGVNSSQLNSKEHHIISNGSCTTNCLAPPLKVIHRELGVVKGLMTTVHSYTNDQRILDLPHSDLRRARAAATSMIPTSTGAAKAIGLVIPELKGKIDGMAIRVPTPNVSLVDVVLEIKRSTTADEVNELLVTAAGGELQGVLACAAEPLVSCDFNGHPASSIVDLLSTKVLDGRMLKVLAWYDNEVGFSHRMLDVALLLAK